MKIYTNQASQFGRELNVLNNVIRFDKVGCAEVDDEVGRAVMKYAPNWYFDKKPSLEIKPKELSFEDKVAKEDLEVAHLEIEKLEKFKENQKAKIKDLEQEVESIRVSMQEVVNENEALKKEKEEIAEITKKEQEDANYKFDLALQEIDELKAICKQMEIPEKEYANKRSKKVLIDLILKAT